MLQGKYIVDLLTKRCAFNSIAIEEVLKEKSLPISPSPVLESILSSPLNSEEDSRAKKLIVAAMHIAAAKGHQIMGDASPLTIAPMVDEAFSRLKVGYLVKKGMRIEEAVDHLIDRSASRLIVLTDRVIKTGVTFVTDKLIDAITVYCPPIAVVAPLVKNLANRLTPVSQKLVREGIRCIADHTKNVVHKVVERIPKILTKTKKIVFG